MKYGWTVPKALNSLFLSTDIKYTTEILNQNWWRTASIFQKQSWNVYFWKRRKIKIKIIFKSFTFNTKNDKLIAKLKILTKTKKHLYGTDIPCYCWLHWSKEISVRISLDVPQKEKKCSFACRRHISPLFQISSHLFMFFSYLRLPNFFKNIYFLNIHGR